MCDIEKFKALSFREIFQNDNKVIDPKRISQLFDAAPNIYSDLIPFFCGNDSWCRKRDRKALEMAKKNILEKYVFVGVLEDLGNSLKLLELYRAVLD